MRISFANLLVLSAALQGCAADCGLPNTALDGRRFQAFGNVIDYTTGQTGAPPGAILVNGYTDIEFQWGAAVNGPVTVVIDDQPFEGEGLWSETECNNFAVSFGGAFLSAEGSTHNFTAAASFYRYSSPIDGSLVEGAVAWNETWTTADGLTVGQLQVTDAAVIGREYAPGQ